MPPVRRGRVTSGVMSSSRAHETQTKLPSPTMDEDGILQDLTTAIKETAGPSHPVPSATKQITKSHKAAELYETLVAQPNASTAVFGQADLSALGITSSPHELMSICQELVDIGLFQTVIRDSDLCYRLKSLVDASKIQSLDKDARIIYNAIDAAGSTGIWTKTLKAKTNLHQTVLTKALRNLEARSYVKQIKNARFPGRKIYMLHDLSPTEEVTGGPFFTDGELDEALIQEISFFILIYVRNNSWRQGPRFKKPVRASMKQRDLPYMLVSDSANSRVLLPYPAGHSGYPTTSDILTFLEQSGIVQNKHLSEADLQILLDVMVFDDKLELITPKSHPSHDSDNDTKSEANLETMYRSVYHPGPPPPKPDSGIMSTNDGLPETQLHANPDQTLNSQSRDIGKGKQKDLRTIDGNGAPVIDLVEPNNLDEVAGTQISKERTEDQELAHLLEARNPFSDTPCAHCPVFNFCQDGTRIDAKSCEYFPKWLQQLNGEVAG